MSDEFPRQYARTRRFSSGVPKQFTITPDGSRVVFIRSGGNDPVQALWTLDLDSATETLVVDPATRGSDEQAVTAEERARRERARDPGAGITTYATDRAVRLATFVLGGSLWIADLESGDVRQPPVSGQVVDPRLDPGGTAIAYVSEGSLHVVDVERGGDRVLAAPEAPDVTYGLAEHVAGEELGRTRGFWWSPDRDRLVIARVDESAVGRWYISDPANPGAEPRAVRYPAAGRPNAEVSLWILGLDGSRVEVDFDRTGYEYVVAVGWSKAGLRIAVQNRAQSVLRVLDVDPATGATTVLREDHDPCWVPVVPGTPAFTSSGALVWTVEEGETRHLLVGDTIVTPVGLQVRGIESVDGETVLFRASDEPTEVHLWTWSPTGGLSRVTEVAGVHSGQLAGGTLVVSSNTLGQPGTHVGATRPGRAPVTIESRAEAPLITPHVEFVRCGELELRTAVLFPQGHVHGSGKLPVLLDPYGGPAGQRVLATRQAYLVSQWFADQGFAVVIADGRGTPGRGPRWDRLIYQNKIDLAVEDQVIALQGVADVYPDLDLGRVAIRGWSYGGTLATATVLRRPDVFHVGVAGAPNIDQRLYNTHFQERYLGHPDEYPDVYDACTLLGDAPKLRRPLMLIHGLADDNVSVAHTFRMSSALVAAGKPHTVLPLGGVTHLTARDELTVNLFKLEVEFIRQAFAEQA
ncbi:S9 family peptidase [Flindersiella endophytica]